MESNKSYDAIIDDIGSKVDNISATEPTAPSVSSMAKGIDKRIVIGVGIFIVMVGLLYYFKPSLVTEEKESEGHESKLVISYKKLLMWALILTGVIGGGLYYYFYVRNKP